MTQSLLSKRKSVALVRAQAVDALDWGEGQTVGGCDILKVSVKALRHEDADADDPAAEPEEVAAYAASENDSKREPSLVLNKWAGMKPKERREGAGRSSRKW